jgi:hypothetical protein
MESKSKVNAITRSVITGFGMTILFVLLGTVLDYIVTQVLSQFILTDCSEDCYFRYFNLFFIFVALMSIYLGIRSGIRTYRRLSE